MPAPTTLAELPLRAVLERVAARTPAPGGGFACATAVALSAALVEMAARFGDGEAELAARARAVRERALGLGQDDLTAYEPVLAALRRPEEDPGRGAAVAAALGAAAGTPLAIAEAGAEVAELGRGIAERGSVHLAGDAVCATVLAEAACRAAASLVEINLRSVPEDGRRAQARHHAEAARVARQHALGGLGDGE